MKLSKDARVYQLCPLGSRNSTSVSADNRNGHPPKGKTAYEEEKDRFLADLRSQGFLRQRDHLGCLAFATILPWSIERRAIAYCQRWLFQRKQSTRDCALWTKDVELLALVKQKKSKKVEAPSVYSHHRLVPDEAARKPASQSPTISTIILVFLPRLFSTTRTPTAPIHGLCLDSSIPVARQHLLQICEGAKLAESRRNFSSLSWTSSGECARRQA
jgi:hypothetical protein